MRLLACTFVAVSTVLAVAPTACPTARRVTVPNVVGRQREPARLRLRQAGLVPRVVYVSSLELVDTVVTERPKAGTRVARRTRVTISVSTGPGP